MIHYSHRPIRSLESDVVAEQLSIGDDGIEKGAEPLVNEDAIHQTMQLSQKLNIESLSKSSLIFSLIFSKTL